MYGTLHALRIATLYRVVSYYTCPWSSTLCTHTHTHTHTQTHNICTYVAYVYTHTHYSRLQCIFVWQADSNHECEQLYICTHVYRCTWKSLLNFKPTYLSGLCVFILISYFYVALWSQPLFCDCLAPPHGLHIPINNSAASLYPQQTVCCHLCSLFDEELPAGLERRQTFTEKVFYITRKKTQRITCTDRGLKRKHNVIRWG